MKTDWQVERLVREWTKHGTLIVALDFDDTIFPYNLNDGAHNARYEHLVALLGACQAVGADIILNTASATERWDEMRRYCEERGLRIAGVNHNMPGLKFGHHGKVYANIYLDDRAGIGEATDILERAYLSMKANRTPTT